MDDGIYIKINEDDELIKKYVNKKSSIDTDMLIYTNEYDNIGGKYIIAMINAYYEDNIYKKYSFVEQYVKMIFNNAYNLYKLQNIKDILDNNNVFELESMRPFDIYFDSKNEMLEKYIEELCALASIRFVPDDRYSDTPKTEMEYLRYEYTKEVTDILEVLRENAYSFVINEIVDSHKTD